MEADSLKNLSPFFVYHIVKIFIKKSELIKSLQKNIFFNKTCNNSVKDIDYNNNKSIKMNTKGGKI